MHSRRILLARFPNLALHIIKDTESGIPVASDSNLLKIRVLRVLGAFRDSDEKSHNHCGNASQCEHLTKYLHTRPI